VKSALPTDGTQDWSSHAGGGYRPSEVREISKLSTMSVQMQSTHRSNHVTFSETLAFASVRLFSGHASIESSSTPAGG
jgi:hypothetical protein